MDSGGKSKLYLKVDSTGEVFSYESPLSIDQKMFLRLIYGGDGSISDNDKLLLSSTNNDMIFEATRYADEGSIRLQANKRNKDFYVMFWDGQIWRMLALKHETKASSIKVSINFKGSQYVVLLSQTAPDHHMIFPKGGLERLLNLHRKFDFKSWSSMNKSIDYLRNWKLDHELEECERSYTKMKVCDDLGLNSILAAIEGESPSSQDENDTAFLATTKQKQEIQELLDESVALSKLDDGLLQRIPESRSTEMCENAILEEAYHMHSKKSYPAGDDHSPLNESVCHNHSNGKEHNSAKRQTAGKRMSDACSKLRMLKIEKRQEAGKRQSEKTPVKRTSEGLEETINCCICYTNETENIQGKLDCGHIFCIGCITDWAKVTNLCPLCKRDFKIIVKQTSKGTLIEDLAIQPKQIDIMELFNEEHDPRYDNADSHCYACQELVDEDLMLVCDHCFRKCCHMYCLSPPIEGDEVPDEPWYCDYCVRDHGVRSTLQCAGIFEQTRTNQGRNRTRLRRGARNQQRQRRTQVSRSGSEVSYDGRNNRTTRTRNNQNLSRHSSLSINNGRQQSRNQNQVIGRQQNPRRGNQNPSVLLNIGRWGRNDSGRGSFSESSLLDPNTQVLVQDHNFQYNESLLSQRNARRNRNNRRTEDNIHLAEPIVRRPPSPLPIHQPRSFARQNQAFRGIEGGNVRTREQLDDDFLDEFGGPHNQGRLARQLQSPPSEERHF